MHVKVLQHHIDEGVKKNPFQCAIALAIREQFPQAGTVSVGTRIIVDDNNWETPRAALAFMSRYDNEQYAAPFEFNVGG